MDTQPSAADTAAAIARLEARMARMEAVLERVSGLLESLSGAATTAVGRVDEVIAELDDAEERREALAATAAIVTEPEVMRAIGHMADQAPRLEAVVDLAAGFEDHVALAFDLGDEFAEGLGDADVSARLQAGAGAVMAATEPDVLVALGRLASQAPRLGPLIARSAQVSDAVVAVLDADPPAPIGPFGLLRSLNDPDVQRALGFAVALAREVGSAVDPTALPAAR